MFKIDEFEAKYETVQKSEDQICKKKRKKVGSHTHRIYFIHSTWISPAWNMSSFKSILMYDCVFFICRWEWNKA